MHKDLWMALGLKKINEVMNVKKIMNSLNLNWTDYTKTMKGNVNQSMDSDSLIFSLKSLILTFELQLTTK